MAIETGDSIKVGKCTFFVEAGFLWIRLPSGRRLAYRDPEIIWRVFEYEAVEEYTTKRGKVKTRRVMRQSEPRKTVKFQGLDKTKKKLADEITFGGRITENIVQAVARDLMMPAMLRLEKAGYIPLLMVHDEGICERKKGKGSLEEFLKILCERPLWADKSLPLDAKGWVGPRYRK
jgi:DNA polymerase